MDISKKTDICSLSLKKKISWSRFLAFRRCLIIENNEKMHCLSDNKKTGGCFIKKESAIVPGR